MHTGPNGAEFTVAKQGDAPTIDSNFHIFFGKVEVEMQVAPGTDIVSAFVMESSVLDEIDYVWPFSPASHTLHEIDS